MSFINRFEKGAYSFERKYVNKNLTSKNDELTEKRLEYWKNFLKDGFENYSKFMNENLNGEFDNIIELLSEENFSVKKTKSITDWFDMIEDLKSDIAKDIKLPDLHIKNENNEKTAPIFYNFYIPFLKLALFRLNSRINDFNIPQKVVNQFVIQLLEKLINISYRTLILELNVAKEEGKLKGENKEERYKYFSEKYVEDKFWEYLEEYPVMFRLMSETIYDWIDNTFGFFDNFYRDIDELVKSFGVSNVIESVDLSISDSHNNGKSVVIVHTDNGKSVVYKPRSLKLDKVFQETIKTFNRLVGSVLYSIEVIDKEDYGWSEYISHKACSDEIEVGDYYEELGELLFILYILRGNDIHYENIIAYGSHPVLIDLETIFHNKAMYSSIETASDEIYEMIEKSVKRVGILPSLVWGKEGKSGVDISAMTNEDDKEIPIESASISGILTDEMKISYRTSFLEKKNNNPFIKEKTIDLSKYRKNLKSGFMNTYKKILQDNSKEKLVEEIGKYKNLFSRQIMRSTQFYSSMIQVSFHPDFLRSALDREMLFSRLWIQMDKENKLERLANLEYISMLKNDIPMFISNITSCDIEDIYGTQVDGFFVQNAMSLVESNIKNLNGKDMLIQSLLISTALNYDPKYNFTENKEIKHEKLVKVDKKYDLEDVKKDYLYISEKIADFLIENSFVGKLDDISWIDMNIIGEKTNDWNMVPVSMDLYSGISGILVYFIFLYKETKKEKYLQVIKRCYNSIKIYNQRRKEFDENGEKILFGGFSGETPIIYSLVVLEEQLGSMFDSNEIELIRNEILLMCERNISNDKDYDIIIGSAGVIAILLKYYEFKSEDYILDLAKSYAENIIKGYVSLSENSIAWKGSFAKSPLGGFAHGTSGIAWALGKLYEYVEDKRYVDVIEKALSYEDLLYKADVKNWSDQRETEDGIKYDDLENNIPVAWCHGASGILLSRLYLYKMNLPIVAERKKKIWLDINNAVETSLKFGFGRSHCLCHGDLGNIEILNLASDILGNSEIKNKCDIYMQYILNDLKEGIWKCGIPYKYSPGMMVGLSGIGYGLLKLRNPNLPSILVLE